MNSPVPVIEQLWTYPIKSCGGVRHDTIKTSPIGLMHDRQFAVVGKTADGDNEVLTQRKHSKLATATLRMAEGGYVVSALRTELSLSAEEEPVDAPEVVTLFEKPGEAVYVNPDLSGLFSELTGRAVRLMQISSPRTIKPATFSKALGALNRTGFADGYPILLTATSSLDQVNAWLNEEGQEAVAMERFRPNVVVDATYDEDGELLPFGEDYWRNLKLGTIGATVVRACARCEIPAINPITGEFDGVGQALNRTLNRHRRGVDPVSQRRGRFFGQNIVHNWISQEVSVDDPVTVYLQANTPNIAELG